MRIHTLDGPSCGLSLSLVPPVSAGDIDAAFLDVKAGQDGLSLLLIDEAGRSVRHRWSPLHLELSFSEESERAYLRRQWADWLAADAGDAGVKTYPLGNGETRILCPGGAEIHLLRDDDGVQLDVRPVLYSPSFASEGICVASMRFGRPKTS